ncbi:hypothetical protein WA026_020346 [Henosepilachna vigintioctopunctata]|uniref:DUF1279 domain-containing protein n=1 Tax=Henosepilachna vigintioctopunctata TaxID=420089 RepID=A0AAW1TZ56_9CUCU
MANIFPRIFRNNFCRIPIFSECRCLHKIDSTINSSTLNKINLLGSKNSFIYTVKTRPHYWATRTYSDDKKQEDAIKEANTPKQTLFQRFKSMYKSYWYVLIPVHVVTSLGWFGGFYYMARSGVDIVGILQSLNVSEKIIDSMRDSHMGYFAITYACYKIATPARYTITLGGTTISINYLKKWGYIKPVPSAEKLKEIYREKKDNFDKTMKEKKDDFMAKKEELKCKIDDHLEQGMHKLEELKEKKNKRKNKAEDMSKQKK